MDPNKLAYFVAKYRACGEEEITELLPRLGSLADEAAAALRQVVAERGMSLPDPVVESGGEAQRAEQTKLATDLWNSSLSKRVQFQFGALAIVFAVSLLGAQGLRAGALWLLVLAAVLYYPASKAGRSFTRSVCANADKSIAEKRRELRNASLILWPAILVPAFLGVMLASVLRGA